ncbi:ribonuclease P protein component [Patescibacteria group bacterium]|nr:ribonuclease P protein component [Patescibacteria group bacterium]MBU4023403.1 ribonuclease P protein component [Patescibacteria group bacterium]
MLALKHRLKKKKDFERTYKSGQTIKQDFLLFKISENNFENPRIGIVISKKTLAKAVARNLVKRRIRESVRHFLPQISKNVDIIITACNGATKDKSLKQIETLIQQAFIKAKIII